MWHSRDNLIFQAAKEKDRNVGDLRKHILTGPILVTKPRQVSGWRKHSVVTLVIIVMGSIFNHSHIHTKVSTS